ncbi:MAG: hypothetical protein ABIB97_04870 [Patescibacteria group bacterium]
MYEIRKLKVVNFALVWMFLAVANYLVFGVVYAFFTYVLTRLFDGGFDSLTGMYSFLAIYLFGLAAVVVLAFIAGLLTAAVYNLISAKMNKGLKIDIVHLVEKEAPPTKKK